MQIGFGVAALLLLGTFALPPMPRANWLIDGLFILVLYPALVALALHHEPSPKVASVAALLGAMSYPAYIVHVPIFRLAMPALIRSGMPLSAAAVTAIAIVPPLALVLFTVYDRPLRARLAARLQT